jgi:signal transduction histidine kinase
MLVLIAWQYPFPYVIAYVLGLTVYQLLVSRSALDLPWAVDAGWLILQGSMMLLVGYVIVAMVSIQREQRDALSRAYQQQTAANVRLQQYAATLEELAISRERNRLARELHDTLAHSLSAVTIQLEAIRALWRNDLDAALAMLGKADQTARSGLTEARRALQDLRATPLEDLGLPLALQDMAQAAAERCGAALELDVPRQLEPGLSPVLEQSVYRIAQEALENIVRHAEARTILVSLSNPGATLRLRIADDGRGAATESGSAPSTEEGARMGVLGMQERAAMIGGRLEIRSEVGQGTEVLLQVPV